MILSLYSVVTLTIAITIAIAVSVTVTACGAPIPPVTCVALSSEERVAFVEALADIHESGADGGRSQRDVLDLMELLATVPLCET